jgi:acyl carrier protein
LPVCWAYNGEKTVNNTQELLKEFIAREFLHDKPVSTLNGQNLVEEGIIDSLAILMLINYIENQFSVMIQPEDVVLENFETIEAISRLIEQRSNS